MDQDEMLAKKNKADPVPKSGGETSSKLIKCVTADCTYKGIPEFDGHCDICNVTWQIIRHWGKKKKPKKRDPSLEVEFSWDEYNASAEELAKIEASIIRRRKPKTRCDECGKRTIIIGYTCRCDGLYCALHRLPEVHQCTFDYRKHGAEEIARNNPKVEAEKIVRF